MKGIRKKQFVVLLDDKHRQLIDYAGEALHTSSSDIIRELIERYTVKYVQEQIQVHKSFEDSLLLIKENTSNYSE